ncbi:MAG: hypothetical protein AB1400_08735 [Pseudomonadota bacterium]
MNAYAWGALFLLGLIAQAVGLLAAYDASGRSRIYLLGLPLGALACVVAVIGTLYQAFRSF